MLGYKRGSNLSFFFFFLNKIKTIPLCSYFKAYGFYVHMCICKFSKKVYSDVNVMYNVYMYENMLL